MVRNIFDTKSSRIIRVLLSSPSRTWVLRELAGEASLSLGMAYYVTSSLVEAGYMIRNDSSKLTLTDPQRLIRRWAAYNNYLSANKFFEYYTFDAEFEAFLSRFSSVPDSLKDAYALTLHAGAWLVAPYVRPTDFHIYVHPRLSKKELTAFAQSLKLSPIERSGNVRLVSPYDEGVFYGSALIDNVRVVSSVQLYVDLYSFPGRGEEAAEKLLDKITKEWKTEDIVVERSALGRNSQPVAC